MHTDLRFHSSTRFILVFPLSVFVPSLPSSKKWGSHNAQYIHLFTPPVINQSDCGTDCFPPSPLHLAAATRVSSRSQPMAAPARQALMLKGFYVEGTVQSRQMSWLFCYNSFLSFYPRKAKVMTAVAGRGVVSEGEHEREGGGPSALGRG